MNGMILGTNNTYYVYVHNIYKLLLLKHTHQYFNIVKYILFYFLSKKKKELINFNKYPFSTERIFFCKYCQIMSKNI